MKDATYLWKLSKEKKAEYMARSKADGFKSFAEWLESMCDRPDLTFVERHGPDHTLAMTEMMEGVEPPVIGAPNEFKDTLQIKVTTVPPWERKPVGRYRDVK